MRRIVAAASILSLLAFSAAALEPSTKEELKQRAAQINHDVRWSLAEVNGLHCDKPASCSIAVGINALLNLLSGSDDIGVGLCAGAHITNENGNILIGDYTDIPKAGTEGFVNIGNKLCFWRATGERVDCPPPTQPCGK